MRRVLAALVVVGLAVAVALSWPRSSPDQPSATLAGPTTTITSPSTTSPRPTTTIVPTATTSTPDGHVVETVEEAEDILRSHYYRWFRGIYERDPTLIESTVVLDSQVEAARAQFGVMPFLNEPSKDALRFNDIEILRSDIQCLVVWTSASATFREGSSSGVAVFRYSGREWKLLSTWQSRDDLWEADCESSLPS